MTMRAGTKEVVAKEEKATGPQSHLVEPATRVTVGLVGDGAVGRVARGVGRLVVAGGGDAAE